MPTLSSKKKLIVGNWKMNPDSLAEAKRIIKSVRKTVTELSRTDVVICPSYVHIPAAISAKSKINVGVGAQDIFYEERGSFTGEVSALALAELGAGFVIVGHSERRWPKGEQKSGESGALIAGMAGITGIVGETDEIVSKKAQATVEAGMIVIVCVGEKEHDAQGAYLEPLKDQIKASLSKIGKKYVRQLVMAYEPIWAIGAKDAMDPAIIQEMTIFVKKVLSDIYGQDEASGVKILYGGSVNFRNAAEIVVKGGVDGLLVGRESVNAPGFSELLKAVDAAR